MTIDPLPPLSRSSSLDDKIAAARYGYIDDIIRPQDTRARLVQELDILRNKVMMDRRFCSSLTDVWDCIIRLDCLLHRISEFCCHVSVFWVIPDARPLMLLNASFRQDVADHPYPRKHSNMPL